MAASRDFIIAQGKTFSCVLRWESQPIVYRAITAIAQTAPVRITCPTHGLPEGWRVAVVSVKGMTEINAEANNLRDADFNPVTVVDANTLEINAINAAGFKAYISGGYVQCNTPVDLTGYTARMSIKNKVGGTELLSLTTENNRIAIDVAVKKITLTVSATETASITWARGVYELEMIDASGVVTCLLSGEVAVTKEVTT